MKRAKIGLAVATLIAAAFGMLSAGATSPVPTVQMCSEVYPGSGAHLYGYCGNHWATYPIRYSVSTAGRPAGMNATAYTNAVIAAADAWNKAWPGQKNVGVTCVVLCYDPAASTKVTWASLGGNPPPLATTTTNPSGATIITSGSIVLNSNRTWKVVSDTDYRGQVVGEIVGDALPGVPIACSLLDCDYYDVQNAMTHEFGHLLGLRHPTGKLPVADSPNATCFPSELADGTDYRQTMYPCIQKGETSKRTLAEGDILGLTQIYNDSL